MGMVLTHVCGLIGDDKNLVFISNQSQLIVNDVENIFPETDIDIDLYHLRQNLASNSKRPQ